MKSKTAKSTVWGLRPNERLTLLILGDLTAGIIALFISLYYWSMGDQWLKFSWKFLSTRPDFWFFLLPLIWILLLVEIYDIHQAARWQDTLRGVIIAAAVCLGMYLVIYFTSTPKSLPRRGVASFILAAFILTLVWRLLYIRIFTAKPFLRRVVILGAGKAGTNLVELIQALSPRPFQVVGWIDDDPEKIDTEILGHQVLGGNESLLTSIEEHGITDVIVAISGELNGSHVPGNFRLSGTRGSCHNHAGDL